MHTARSSRRPVRLLSLRDSNSKEYVQSQEIIDKDDVQNNPVFRAHTGGYMPLQAPPIAGRAFMAEHRTESHVPHFDTLGTSNVAPIVRDCQEGHKSRHWPRAAVVDGQNQKMGTEKEPLLVCSFYSKARTNRNPSHQLGLTIQTNTRHEVSDFRRTLKIPCSFCPWPFPPPPQAHDPSTFQSSDSSFLLTRHVSASSASP